MEHESDPSLGNALLRSGGDLAFGLAGVFLLVSIGLSLQIPEGWHKVYFEGVFIELVGLGLSTPFFFLLASRGDPNRRYRFVGIVLGSVFILIPVLVGIIERDLHFIQLGIVMAVLAANRMRVLWKTTEAERQRLRLRAAVTWVSYLGFLTASLYLSAYHAWPDGERHHEFHVAGTLHFLIQGLFEPVAILAARRRRSGA